MKGFVERSGGFSRIVASSVPHPWCKMFAVVGAFPLFLLCSAALVAIWMVLIVLERIMAARVVEALTIGCACMSVYMYVSQWGFTLPRW